MKLLLPVTLVVVTAALMVIGLTATGQAGGTVGIAAGSAMYGLTPKASTPEQAVRNLLVDVRRHNWDLAFSTVSNLTASDEQSFIQDWTGSNGDLRSFSNVGRFMLPPHQTTNDEAQMRADLDWTPPVSPIEDVHPFHLRREGDTWKTVWP